MNRSTREPPRSPLALYRPDGWVLRSTHGQGPGVMRKLARLLTSEGIPWGYMGSERPETRMVVWAERSWLETQIRELKWETVEIVRRA